MTTLSVMIITKNEAANIAACIDSVAFADEIIVVDSNSTDGTLEICQSKGVKISQTADFPGFGPQKNRALALTNKTWVLAIDADERVTPELANEIKTAIQSSEFKAYNIPRLSSYCGRWMRYSGWYPDYVLRLFHRNGAQFSNDLVHEKILLSDHRIGKLKNHFLHYSYLTPEDVIKKMNVYSTLGAKMRYKKSSLKKAILHGLWAFIRTYFLQRGFLDGREGFMLAVSNAEGVYYRYLKMIYIDPSLSRH